MAYTSAQLIAAYTAANNGVEPDAATTALLNAFAVQTQTGQMTDAAALSYVINSAQDDVQVAVQAYQFFTGAIPSSAGLDYLTNSTDNANDLNDAYYAQFNLENRYINFAANLGLNGEGSTAFADAYGDLTFASFVDVIYETVIGSSYATAAGINVAAAKADIAARYNNFVQLATERGMITSASTPEQIDLAVKASVVGYLMAEGVKADVGVYAAGANNFVNALVDGDAQYGVNLLDTYSVLGGGTGTPPGGSTAGKSFVLTDKVDNLVGGAGADTFIADNSGANVTSLADAIEGGAGNDTLTVYGFATGDAVPQMSNVENVVFDNSADTATVSLAGVSGVTSVTVQNAVGATDTTVGSGVAVTLKSNADATKAQVVDYGATATSATLVLNGVTTNTGVDVEAQGAAVTTLNIQATGAASTVGQLEVDAAMAKVVITGDKNLTITDAVESAVNVIDASAFTGKLNVSTANEAVSHDTAVSGVDVVDLTVKGGSGADTINVSANAANNEVVVAAGGGDDKVVIAAGVAYSAATATNAGDSIDGGEGATDTLSVGGDLSASDLSKAITNFEVLEFTADAAGTDMSVNKLAINSFVLSGDDTDVVLTGLANASTVKITGDGSDLTATIGTDTTTDSITVNLESTSAVTGSNLTLNNYDSAVIQSTKAATDAATVVNRVNTMTAANVASVTINGTQDLTITSATLKANAAVDASALSGALTATFVSALKSYVGGSGKDTLTLADGNLAQGATFAGGAGVDKLTVKANANQDLGIVGLTGFETLALTTQGANVADFRNVTDLATLAVTAGAGGDDLTVNRISGDTTLTFTNSIDQVVTTVNTGTSQKVAFSAAATVTNLTLDSGTTTLTITSDDGDAVADEGMGVFTDIDGTSLASIVVLGNDRLNLGTLEATTTSVDASASKGGLTVTASGTATTIIGSQAADAITGGAGKDVIQGGKGADVLDGGGASDQFVFEATGAANGSDTLTFTAGASGDVLNFKNFLSGGSVEQNGAAGTGINEFGAADGADVNITGKVALYSDATATNIDAADEIAALIQGAGDAFSLTAGGKAVLVTGDAASALGPVNIWFIDDTLDGVTGTISAADVALVGTIAATDLDTLITTNFLFA